MSNFVSTLLSGKTGLNLGLTTGIKPLDKAINRMQRGTSIGVAAAPKCGKTTFADSCFLIHPYLEMLEFGSLDDIEWIYYSYEIDRINKEFKFASFFMNHDYGIFDFECEGNRYLMSQDYLMGRLARIDATDKRAVLSILPEHEDLLKEVYLKRIVPLFGEWSASNRLIRKGKIEFIVEPETPTSQYKHLLNYASNNGHFEKEPYYVAGDDGVAMKKHKIVGYTPKNPKKFTIVFTDHIRKMERERGLTMKENMDKWLSFSTLLRNICNFTFINICHSNRQLANVERLKYAGEFVFPTADDVKDTGNLAEESVILITLFNPNDEKYNLDRHFGVDLKHHPNYRSIHIAESRFTESPVHIQANMYGNIATFSSLVQH